VGESLLKPSDPILAFSVTSSVNRLEKYETVASLMPFGEVRVMLLWSIRVIIFLLFLIFTAKWKNLVFLYIP
jgi:hypothetical protein